VEFERIVVDYVRATYGGEAKSAALVPQRKTIAVKAMGSARSSGADSR
jgi:hypothetical protein